jgi:predicted MFS family arabinose efflux permease
LNGLFTGINFVGSAIGSALTGVVWQEYGWTGVCWTGIAFGLAACAAHTVLGHSNVLGKGKRLTEVPRL